MSITLQICTDYCQQSEALPLWKYAAVVCIGLASIRIVVWVRRKWKECRNKGILPSKYLKNNNVIYIRIDEEYKGYMKGFYRVEYLSYYSFFLLIMSALEYLVEGNVGSLARLEMWGIVGAFIGVLIFSLIWKIITISDTWYVKKKGVSLVWGWIVKRNGGISFASMMASTTPFSFFRIVVYTCRLISLVPMIFICFTLAYYFLGLGIIGAIITTTIPVLIVFCDLVGCFIREDEILYFKEQQLK